MHTLSACGTSPQLLMLPVPGGFCKPGCATERTKAFPTIFRGVDFTFTESEIVPDLVPNRIGYDPLQMCRVAGHLFVGALKDPDAIGTFERRFAQATLGDGTSFVKAKKVRRRAHRLNDDDKIPHTGAKPAGNVGDGAFHNRVECFGCEP